MTSKIMFDLETLGKNPGCIVLSIGVVEFDMTGILKEYQVFFDPIDQEAHGLRAEADTVMWWLNQSKDAQNALLQGQTRSVSDGLNILINNTVWKDKEVWVNGASFDFPILKALFTAGGHRNVPWKYSLENCLRSLKQRFNKDVYEAFRVKPELAHDGLSDARAQALTVINLLKSLQAPVLSAA